MATTIRKCLSFTPFEPLADGTSTSENDLRNRIDEVRATGVRWVKIWAQWDKINSFQTEWTRIGDFATNPVGAPHLIALDQQVALAYSHPNPIAVIITSYGCPAWARTPGVSPNNPSFDRLGFPRPEHLGVNGAFGDWCKFMMNRYAKYGWHVAFEFMNEPNLQMWPQRVNGENVSGCYAAQMMATAQATSAGVRPAGDPILIIGPATADRDGYGAGNTDKITNGITFTVWVFEALRRIGVPGSPKLCLESAQLPRRPSRHGGDGGQGA